MMHGPLNVKKKNYSHFTQPAKAHNLQL